VPNFGGQPNTLSIFRRVAHSSLVLGLSGLFPESVEMLTHE
jgi:hypothetical protein